MNKPRETPIFPMAVEPVRKGIYRHHGGYSSRIYSFWDGKQWCSNHWEPKIAAKHRQRSQAAYSGTIKGWSGLTEPSK